MKNFGKRCLSYALAVIILTLTLPGCGKILNLGGDSSNQNQQIQNNKTPKTDNPATARTSNDATDASTEYDPEDLAWAGDLVSFQYYPGYGDMNGGRHYQFLVQKDGEWFIECCDQEMIGEPVVTVTYSVSESDVQAFGNFLKANHVDQFMEREDGHNFMTDYSEWRYNICFTDPEEDNKYIHISFDEYKEYTDADYELMNEIDKRFDALKKNEISRTEKVDE